MQGKIKWFSKKKGYGFITKEDGTDVFVHISSLIGSRIPREDEPVSFEMGTGKTDHPAAINVNLLSSRPSPKTGHSHSSQHASKQTNYKKHGILTAIFRFIFGK